MTRSDSPTLNVITGRPGAGKTTIAATVAARLGLPLIAKDAIKDALAGALEIGGDRHASQRLGGATFETQYHILGELLARGLSVIAEGNFTRSEPFLALPPARVVQVHVSAPPALLRARLATRAGQHPSTTTLRRPTRSQHAQPRASGSR